MPRIAIVEVTGPFVLGKRRGHRLTLPANDPTLKEWEGTGQVRITYRDVAAVPDLAPSQRVEALAQRVAGDLDSLGTEAQRLSDADRRSLWGRVRSLPRVQAGVLALLGLSLAAGEEEQAAPPAQPAPEGAEIAGSWTVGGLADLRRLLGLGEDAGEDDILDAVDDLVDSPEASPEDLETASEIRASLGLAAEAGPREIVGAIEALKAPRALPEEGAASEIPPAAAILVAEVLAHPEAFTLEGVRIVASKAGIELPERGTKATVLEVFALAVEGAKAAPPAQATPPAPPAPPPANPAPSVPFMDDEA